MFSFVVLFSAVQVVIMIMKGGFMSDGVSRSFKDS